MCVAYIYTTNGLIMKKGIKKLPFTGYTALANMGSIKAGAHKSAGSWNWSNTVTGNHTYVVSRDYIGERAGERSSLIG